MISNVASEVNIIPGLLDFCFRLWLDRLKVCHMFSSAAWNLEHKEGHSEVHLFY